MLFLAGQDPGWVGGVPPGRDAERGGLGPRAPRLSAALRSAGLGWDSVPPTVPAFPCEACSEPAGS